MGERGVEMGSFAFEGLKVLELDICFNAFRGGILVL